YVYDPATSTWVGAGQLICPRYGHLAIPLRGWGALLVGGVVAATPVPHYTVAPVRQLEMFSKATGAWTAVSATTDPPTSPENYYSATPLPDGTILFVGDADGMRAALLRY